jgi:hypothetical protein
MFASEPIEDVTRRHGSTGLHIGESSLDGLGRQQAFE